MGLLRALGIAFVPWLAIALGCSDGALQRSSEPASALTGTTGVLESRIVRLRSGTSETRYRLRFPDESTTGLRFSDRPRLPMGTPITVWGPQVDGVIQVESFAVATEEGELGS